MGYQAAPPHCLLLGPLVFPALRARLVHRVRDELVDLAGAAFRAPAALPTFFQKSCAFGAPVLHW